MFTLVTCGDVDFPEQLAHIIAMVVNFIYIGVPILLIIWGMLDLGKAVISQKEDDIKKGQKTFIQRAIAAVMVFLIFSIVQLIFSLLGNAGGDNPMDCVKCMINNECQ